MRRATNVRSASPVPGRLPGKTPKKQAGAQFSWHPAAIELRGGVRYTGTRLIRGEIRGGKTVGPGAASAPARR